MKISYLGPHGTFTEYSAFVYTKKNPDYEYLPCMTVYDALSSVSSGISDEAIVPFENSIEGTVTNTLDTMIFDVDLYVKDEIIIPVSQNFMVNKNYQGEKITKIMSHPQGLAQCYHYLRTHYPNVPVESVSSTAESARIVAKSQENWAAIGAKFAAEVYDLKILHPEIQDKNHNETRFLVLTKENTTFCQKGKKTSIVFSTKNRPGELYRILDIFSIWDLNMTKIESRPMKNELGTYLFFVDLETEKQKDLEDALTMVKRKSSYFKYLGSYPVHKEK